MAVPLFGIFVAVVAVRLSENNKTFREIWIFHRILVDKPPNHLCNGSVVGNIANSIDNHTNSIKTTFLNSQHYYIIIG